MTTKPMGVTTLTTAPSKSRRAGAVASLLASVLLASCSGGGGGVGNGSGTSTQGKHATLSIKIAGNGAQSKLYRMQQKRRPKYVSQATNGIAVYVYAYGGNPGSSPTAVADVSATSPYCTVDSDGSGDRICGIPITAPVGNDDFLVDGYDQPPKGGVVQGNELETGTAINVPIAQGGANQVNVTFDGIIAAVQIVPIWQTSQNDGQGHTYSFSVNAQDSDGYQIIDVTPFANALSVVIQNDPNKTLSITPPPQGTDPRFYTLNYNGGTVNDAQIVASASGVAASTTMDFTPLITNPNKLTVSISGQPQPFTAQMAVPADQTPQSYQYFTVQSEEQANCTVNPSGNDAAPWTNGNPVTFEVTGVSGTGCSVYVVGPETNTGFAIQTIQVTITP